MNDDATAKRVKTDQQDGSPQFATVRHLPRRRGAIEFLTWAAVTRSGNAYLPSVSIGLTVCLVGLLRLSLLCEDIRQAETGLRKQTVQVIPFGIRCQLLLEGGH